MRVKERKFDIWYLLTLGSHSSATPTATKISTIIHFSLLQSYTNTFFPAFYFSRNFRSKFCFPFSISFYCAWKYFSASMPSIKYISMKFDMFIFRFPSHVYRTFSSIKQWVCYSQRQQAFYLIKKFQLENWI